MYKRAPTLFIPFRVNFDQFKYLGRMEVSFLTMVLKIKGIPNLGMIHSRRTTYLEIYIYVERLESYFTPSSHNNSLPGLGSFNTGLSRVLCLKYGVHLLERESFGFDKKEVHKGHLKSIPKCKEHIEPVPNLGNRLAV